jgi:hypothetical protein
VPSFFVLHYTNEVVASAIPDREFRAVILRGDGGV